ncbi:MAG: amylo-alpha-1,6-glucosidase [Bacteroidetes bacterium HGW-Bacteroidetes-21]|jgi:predicted glycogen debranching enzyme|nr:MAG: amylo-alpha-1,6-glucosidase [Bacteroidetes bacterium HGW-Bacteroidetes-21]
MSYIKFDKTQLINLEYSLDKEIIRSNRSGAYAFTTLIGTNTRKYHCLLACPVDHPDGGVHLLLSALDETVIQHGASFNLGLHKYPGGIYEPKGHKYIRDFGTEPNISLVYRVGGVVLEKEMVLITGKEQILIRYTLLEAHSPTTLQFRPFLAYRNIHSLSKANLDVSTKYQKIKNGIRIRMYDGYPYLYLQFSKAAEYVHVPSWNRDIEYIQEQRRGYEYNEDLFVPGYFEVPIKKGETIVFSASTSEAQPTTLKQKATREMQGRIPRDNFENCLINSAQQFINTIKNKKIVLAGLPWYSTRARDTFISLPGLTLAMNDLDSFHAILKNCISSMQGPLFPDAVTQKVNVYTSADAPLWFIWAIQKYCDQTNDFKGAWEKYGKTIKKILNGFRAGIIELNLRTDENGLVWAGTEDSAYTWMNAHVDGKPVTPRYGYVVEINALWYNAIMFTLSLAKMHSDYTFYSAWKEMPPKIGESFRQTFLNDTYGYLSDCVNEKGACFCLRPNQLLAASLFYTPIEDELTRKGIIDRIERELLTQKGLRSLSPNCEEYKGMYEGDHNAREMAMHQGSAYPWLMAHFAEAYLKIYGMSGIAFIQNLYHQFEEDIREHGIGTISELYDGDPPHKPGGAPSMAMSVAEIIRMKQIIDEYNL